MRLLLIGSRAAEIVKRAPKVSVFDLDDLALEHAKRQPRAMNLASAPSPAAALEDDPQIVELQGQHYIAKEFKYVANFQPVPLNGSLATNIQIDSDADFQLINLIGTRDAGGAGAGLNVQITEGGAGGLAWQSAAVNFDNFFGTAQLPFPFGLIPQLMPKKRVYNILLTNTTGANINAQIVFDGYKLFPVNMAAQVGAQPTPAGQ